MDLLFASVNTIDGITGPPEEGTRDWKQLHGLFSWDERKALTSGTQILKAQMIARRLSQRIRREVLNLLPASVRSAMLLLIALWVKQGSHFNYSLQESRAELLVLLHLLLHGTCSSAKSRI